MHSLLHMAHIVDQYNPFNKSITIVYIITRLVYWNETRVDLIKKSISIERVLSMIINFEGKIKIC